MLAGIESTGVITTHSIALVEGICEILGDEEYCKYRDATTWEWTPTILPNRVLDAGLNADWYSLLTKSVRHRQEPQDGGRHQRQKPGTGRHGRPSDRQAWATMRPHGGVRGGLPAALTVARNDSGSESWAAAKSKQSRSWRPVKPAPQSCARGCRWPIAAGRRVARAVPLFDSGGCSPRWCADLTSDAARGRGAAQPVCVPVQSGGRATAHQRGTGRSRVRGTLGENGRSGVCTVCGQQPVTIPCPWR